jgi:hypothetical protein
MAKALKVWVRLIALAVVAALHPPYPVHAHSPGPAKESKEKPRKDRQKAFAVVAGTVFRDPGFAFPGVAIVLEPAPEGKTSLKVKKMEAVSDSRGEFAFRVPAVAMRYNLIFQAAGYGIEKRTVTIAGEERQDVYVTLHAAKEGAR